MTELIHRLIQSNDNCFAGEYYDPTHRTDEIYTCLDCLEAGIRAADRERIIKLLEELDNHGSTHSERCARTHAFVDMAIALIKAEN